MIWANVSKGEVFSVNPSPLSNDMTLIFPVDFFMIVLITTELGTYSMISRMIYAIDFSSLPFSGVICCLPLLLSSDELIVTIALDIISNLLFYFLETSLLELATAFAIKPLNHFCQEN